MIDDDLPGAWSAPTAARGPRPVSRPPARRTSPLSWIAASGLVVLAGLCGLGMLGGESQPHPLQQRSTGELRELSLRLRGLVAPTAARGDHDLARRLRQAADALDDGQASAVDTATVDALIVELRDRGIHP